MKTILCHISISEMMAVHSNKAGTHATCFGITYSSILIVLFSSSGIVGHVSTETAWLGMVCFPFRGFSTVKWYEVSQMSVLYNFGENVEEEIAIILKMKLVLFIFQEERTQNCIANNSFWFKMELPSSGSCVVNFKHICCLHYIEHK